MHFNGGSPDEWLTRVELRIRGNRFGLITSVMRRILSNESQIP
jgi:hypothetical protein